MSELHGGHECFDGFIQVDRVKELEKRGADPVRYPYSRFMKPCPECAIQNMTRSTGGAEMFWDNWIDRTELADALDEFRRWYPNGMNWACLLHGRPNEESRSTGRTHILSATGTAYIKAGRSVRYWNAGDLSVRRYESLSEPITEFKGLALVDDLGNESNNLDTRDAVDRILDARFRNRRPSIVTSSLPLDIIEKRYPRFGTRMKAGTTIAWSASPYSAITSDEPEEEFR